MASPASFSLAKDSLNGALAETDRMRKLKRCVESLLSDSSLATDSDLWLTICKSLPDGWICSSSLRFSATEARELRPTPAALAEALMGSHLETWLERQGAATWLYLRRWQAPPPLLLHVDGERFLVLADPWNSSSRLQSLSRMRLEPGLQEIGDETTVICESASGLGIATGYVRLVCGDHGFLVELSAEHVCWGTWPHFFDKSRYDAHFDELYTEVSHKQWEENWRVRRPKPSRGVLMLHAQRRPIMNVSSDVRPGYFYIMADPSLIHVTKDV